MHISNFTSSLKNHFSLSKPRLDCLALFLTALLKARTANLTHVACCMDSKACTDSCYQRLRRFLAQAPLQQEQIARWAVSLFFHPQARLLLTLDRTDWKWGKHPMNFLVLAAVHQGIAIPLFWTVLPKKGNSNLQERKALLKRFIACFGRCRISCLLADREFIGHKWFTWLQQQQVHFVIRIRENAITTNASGLSAYLSDLVRPLQVGQWRVFQGKRRLWERGKVWVYLAAARSHSGELCVLATDSCADTALDIYPYRWKIETLFQTFKSRGFQLEATHITTPARLECLMGVLTIALCCCQASGMWYGSQRLIRRKRHGRLQQSLFRYGLDWLCRGLQQASASVWTLLSRWLCAHPHPASLIVPYGHGDPYHMKK